MCCAHEGYSSVHGPRADNAVNIPTSRYTPAIPLHAIRAEGEVDFVPIFPDLDALASAQAKRAGRALHALCFAAGEVVALLARDRCDPLSRFVVHASPGDDHSPNTSPLVKSRATAYHRAGRTQAPEARSRPCSWPSASSATLACALRCSRRMPSKTRKSRRSHTLSYGCQKKAVARGGRGRERCWGLRGHVPTELSKQSVEEEERGMKVMLELAAASAWQKSSPLLNSSPTRE